jgi:hypothetical protein
MSSSVVEANPRAQDVLVSEDELTVALADGRRISVPLAWFPRLLHATAAQRSNWELLGTERAFTGLKLMKISVSLESCGALRLHRSLGDSLPPNTALQRIRSAPLCCARR